MTQARYPALTIALLLASGVAAQAPSPSIATPAGMTLQQYLSIARGRIMDRDSDGDGRISAAEFAAGGGMRRGAKARTGAAAPASDDAAAPAPAGGMGGDMASRMFQRFDTNNDGYLDKAEIDAMLTRRFERMDTNHDGIVTAAEREASRGAMRGGGAQE